VRSGFVIFASGTICLLMLLADLLDDPESILGGSSLYCSLIGNEVPNTRKTSLLIYILVEVDIKRQQPPLHRLMIKHGRFDKLSESRPT